MQSVSFWGEVQAISILKSLVPFYYILKYLIKYITYYRTNNKINKDFVFKKFKIYLWNA